MSDKKKERDKNREEMPNVAAMLDRIREANPELMKLYGGFKVVGAEDKVTGKKKGKF